MTKGAFSLIFIYESTARIKLAFDTMKKTIAAIAALMSVFCFDLTVNAQEFTTTTETSFNGNFLTNQNRTTFDQLVHSELLEYFKKKAGEMEKSSDEYLQLGKLYIQVRDSVFTTPTSEAVRRTSPFATGGSEQAMTALQDGQYIMASTPILQLIIGNIQTTFGLTNLEIERGWYGLTEVQKRRVKEFDKYSPGSKELKFDGVNGKSKYELSLSGEFGFEKGKYGMNYIFLIDTRPLRTPSPLEADVFEKITSLMATYGEQIGGVRFEDALGAYVTLSAAYNQTGNSAGDAFKLTGDFNQETGWTVFTADGLRIGTTTETVVLNGDFTTGGVQSRKNPDGPGIINRIGPCTTFDSWHHENRDLPYFVIDDKVVFPRIKTREGNELAFTVGGELHKMVLPEKNSNVFITSTP